MERDEHGHAKKGGKGNFNSHAHVERDNVPRYVDTFEKISTHTLTWSVTSPPMNVQKQAMISTHTLTWSVTVQTLAEQVTADISTHTLTWSVTVPLPLLIFNPVNFNSHAHVERD